MEDTEITTGPISQGLECKFEEQQVFDTDRRMHINARSQPKKQRKAAETYSVNGEANSHDIEYSMV